jgi:hypothetical protein
VPIHGNFIFSILPIFSKVFSLAPPIRIYDYFNIAQVNILITKINIACKHGQHRQTFMEIEQ